MPELVAWTTVRKLTLMVAGMAGSPGGLVLRDLAALHDDVLRRLDVDAARAVDGDVLALDGDRAVLLHDDAGLAGLERDLVASGDHQHLADVERVVLADAVAAAVANRHRLVF